MNGPPARDGRPVFSVCVANYNGRDVIAPCLASVFDQEFAGGVEVLVHDDASTDGSAHIVSRHFPGARLVTSEINVGFCESNNRLAELASGRLLLFLNNDAMLRPGALAALYGAAEGHKPCVVGLAQYDAATGDLLDRGSLLDPFLNSVPNLDPDRGFVGMVTGACLCIDKSLFDAVGGFPRWFGSLAEDLFVCLAARGAGRPVLVARESGFDHFVGSQLGGGKVVDGGLSTTYSRRARTELNKCRTMALLWPRSLLLTVFGAHLALLAAEGAALSLVKKDVEPWRRIYGPCLASLWRERGLLARERKRLAAFRRHPPWYGHRVFTPVPHKLRMLLRHGPPKLD